MPMFAKKVGSPVDQIMSMRQQGMSNDQIIQSLQSQGIDPSQIFDAMNQIDGGGYNQQQMAQGPSVMPQNGGMGGYGPEEDYSLPSDDKERVEEIAEAIIDEKWEDLLKNINKISEWNNKTELRLTKLETELKDLKESFETLHKGILGKISEYDQNLVNVGTEIKAMEKVFQKILPTFTDNVNRLSRMVQHTPPSDIRKKQV